jgi:glycosyltransferase involved in cell wall biosynthesis
MSEKVKIAFVSNYMVLGGIEKSLLDLCWLLPKEEYDITLILREKRGEFLTELPQHVQVKTLPLSEEAQFELEHGRVPCLKWCLKNIHILHVVRMLWSRLCWYLKGHKYIFDFPALSTILKATPDIFNMTFDLAVAYFGDFEWATCVVLDYLKAKKKICWTHSELPYYQMDRKLFDAYYSRFDYRYACSKATAKRINDAIGIPDLVKAVPHVLNPQRMHILAETEEVCTRSKNIPVILTVGRLDSQKGIDIAINVHKKLLDAGAFHHWYIVGHGSTAIENKLREHISQNDVNDSFFLEGGKLNPYPYFKRCDIYVQPSRFEGYCLTVAEARAFAKPIVATDFDGAREQLKDGKTGFIVQCNENELVIAVKKIMDNPQLRNLFSQNLKNENINTQDAVLNHWRKMVRT